ncbi:uncharacterized protein KY384_005695 [Bacidia gigantensis]|uniref:uncharacterized protein n=1 Tax=Bacidia gigantensis TaxID=2732470 RepID=UPI001D0415C5|nr:uncharacterized protein KY384_005695 [Bacidia gigantensis]KAG8529060.1 hypothetical protein KY384_005695 [Bacidia gigantensis]
MPLLKWQTPKQPMMLKPADIDDERRVFHQAVSTAVSASVGTDQTGKPLNMLDLYPGGFAYHLFYATDYCSNSQQQTCAAASAGLYDPENSTTANQNITDAPGVVQSQGSDLAQKTTGNASILVDSVSFNTTAGLTTVENSAIDSIHEQDITLPNGATYSPQVGFLALGGLDGERKYQRGNGMIIPNHLAGKDIIPSASTSLHYGSANLGPEGSLVWGGYDQSRIIGSVGQFDITKSDSKIEPNLLDIQIGTEKGGSPFPQDSYVGLLALNETFGYHQPTEINAVLPYLYMSKDTCTNIARLLPVNFEPGIGLYMWNVNDPQYKRITTSPTYLSFIFPAQSTTNHSTSTADTAANNISPTNITIKVPFSLLDLTLEAPIVPTPRQYFPCYPFNALDQSGRYFLGRAFLQSTFLAMNFNQSTFFLAQAPGPEPDAPNIQSILPDQATLTSSPAGKFAQSWSAHWTPLPARPAASPPKAKANDALSGGAIAGISVGVVVAALACAAAAIFWVLRKRKAKKAEDEGEKVKQETDYAKGPNGLHEKDTESGWTAETEGAPVAETDGSPIAEAAGHQYGSMNARFEMAGGNQEGTARWIAELPDDKTLPEMPASRSGNDKPLPEMPAGRSREDLRQGLYF